MSFENMPRWALVSLCGVFLAGTVISVKFIVSSNYADQIKTKEVAWKAKADALEAKEIGKDALENTEVLQVQVAEVRGAQETFRKEYREDQKTLDNKLSQLISLNRRAINE